MRITSPAYALLAITLAGCASTSPRTQNRYFSASTDAQYLVVPLDRLPPVEFDLPPLCERREVGVVCRRNGYSLMFSLGTTAVSEEPAWLDAIKVIAAEYPEVELHVCGYGATNEESPLRLASERARVLVELLRAAGVRSEQIFVDPPIAQRSLPIPHFEASVDGSRRAEVSIVGDVTVSRLPARAP